MSTRRNILSNYVGAAFTAIVPMLALPWYLDALGPQLWGLIGFIATLQAVLGILDAGLGQALAREMAVRLSEVGVVKWRAASLLFGFERVYWVFAMAAAVITAACADLIATNWLRLGDLPSWDGRLAIYGAAALFFLQLPATSYRSVLVSAKSQETLNLLNVVFILLRHGVGVVVVSLHPTLLAYLIWQVIISFADTMFRGIAAWRTVAVPRRSVQWDTGEIRHSLQVAIPMSGAVFLGLVATQLDKVILSRIVPIEQFGFYMIASSVAFGVLQLVGPVNQGVWPRLVALRNNRVEQRRLNIKHAAMNLILVGGASMTFAVFGHVLLDLWLRNSEVSDQVYLPLLILLVGTAANSLYSVGYLNWIANGKVARITFVNALAVLAALALVPVLADRYGLAGAATSWLGINVIGAILSLEWLRTRSSMDERTRSAD